MFIIIKYIQYVFSYIISILNVQPFPDFPISIFQLLCCTLFLKYIFRFVFGGFNEIEYNANWFNSSFISKSINNINRKYQLNNNSDSKLVNSYSSSPKIKKASKKEIKEIDDMLNRIS